MVSSARDEISAFGKRTAKGVNPKNLMEGIISHVWSGALKSPKERRINGLVFPHSSFPVCKNE